MTRTHWIQVFLFCILIAIGIFLGGFGGGVMTGISITCIILVTAGRVVAAAGAAQIDKTIQDEKERRRHE